MLNREDLQNEVERRKSGGNLSIPSPKEGESIKRFFTTPERMYFYSQYGIYQVLTSDDIDPDVTQMNVPWTVNRYISVGSNEKIFGFLLGMELNVCECAIIEDEEQKIFRSKLLSCLVSLNELVFAKKFYEKEYTDYTSSIEGLSVNDIKDGTGLQIPVIENFEVIFGLFFMSLKRFLTNLFSVCEWACGFEEGKGAQLDKLIRKVENNRKLSLKVGDLELLKRHQEAVKSLNEIRNAYEHPSSSLYLELKNVTFLPPANLVEPSFRVVKNERLDDAEWYQFAPNIDRIYNELCSLVRDILIVVAVVKTNSSFPWQVVSIPPDQIDEDLPIDCKFQTMLPKAIIDQINKGK